jgi:LPXTG-motif cell wall-anchored protein
METTLLVRVVAGALAVLAVAVIILRRKKKAS